MIVDQAEGRFNYPLIGRERNLIILAEFVLNIIHLTISNCFCADFQFNPRLEKIAWADVSSVGIFCCVSAFVSLSKIF